VLVVFPPIASSAPCPFAVPSLHRRRAPSSKKSRRGRRAVYRHRQSSSLPLEFRFGGRPADSATTLLEALAERPSRQRDKLSVDTRKAAVEDHSAVGDASGRHGAGAVGHRTPQVVPASSIESNTIILHRLSGPLEDESGSMVVGDPGQGAYRPPRYGSCAHRERTSR
jgi:hypothetical protein